MKKSIAQQIYELEKKLESLYQNEEENDEEICQIEEELRDLRWDFDSQIF